jgi:hypothetical protein
MAPRPPPTRLCLQIASKKGIETFGQHAHQPLTLYPPRPPPFPLCLQIAFKKDVFETLDQHRDDFIDWRPTWNLVVFLVRQALPSTSSSFKNIAATKKEIADHYDMGNDFFGAFMGPLMIYTSAIYHGLHQTLEQVR